MKLRGINVQSVQTILSNGSIVQGRYVVEELLGKGGFGAVYLVRDQRVRGNRFALKEVIDPNKKERMRFTFEGEVLKRLDHAGLPRVYRAFDDDKKYRAYILMDYIEGPNLETLRQMQPQKRFPLTQVMQLMQPIFEALSYLHKQHPPVVHRDIKPANIIVPPSGAGAVLVDFGIAKEFDEEGTTTAVRRCSPGYGAPEQYDRGTNLRTDIYGLAATLYALLTGSIPTDALYRLTQLGTKHADPLEPVSKLAPNVPGHVSDAIMQAMSIGTNERFESVEAFWRALQAQPAQDVMPMPIVQTPVTPVYMHNTTPMTPPLEPQTTVPQSRSSKRRRVFIPLLALIALLALSVGLLAGNNLLSAGASIHPTGVVGRPTAKSITPTAPVATVRPTSAPTTQPTAVPTQPVNAPAPQPTAPSAPAPQPAPGGYPQLLNYYGGTISDRYTTPATGASITLSQLRQNGSAINGSFAVGSGLLAGNTFSGSVTSDRKINFTVPGYSGLPALFFTGQIQSDGSLTGTYCSINASGQCDRNIGGWGDWNAAPPGHPSSFVPDGIAFEEAREHL
jgi:serine/threonine protein kinase